MLKSIPNLQGTLAVATSAVAVLWEVDQQSADLLRNKLLPGDWAYALVTYGSMVEVVKIESVDDTPSNIVTVEREIDGTVGQEFPVGAQLAYHLGAAAVADIVAEEQLAEITITGTGLADVTDNGGGSFTVNVEPMVLTSDEPRIAVAGVYPNYAISVAYNIDCCDPPEEVEAV